MGNLVLTDNAREVLKRRYLRKGEDGSVIEEPEDMFRRVADAIAEADKNYDENADVKATSDKFYNLMTDLRFLPNSPTLMNAGRPLGQLSACFVLPVEDTMEGIFESIKQAALIHKSGGGTGFSFSRLRPAGSTVNSTGGVASGPISFMRVFNMATEAVKQGGTRRGANMGILRVDHPDILDFITCKQDNSDITNFNISVGITEQFMQAVEQNERYGLIDPSNGEKVADLSAREVFQKIVDNAWNNGEPGIIFLDRLNRDNIVPSEGEIEATNPCGEQPLLPYESCNLGSINLAKMVYKKENGSSDIDSNLLGNTIYEAVHFLDNVIDANNYPLDKIDEQTKKTRKIGLGVMGFADMLLQLGIPYDSDAAVDLADKIMEFINRIGHQASEQLAKVRGAFPLFGDSVYKDGAKMRNGTVTTIAPTGTISIMANASSGVEPVFAYAYVRNVMDGTKLVESNPILKEKLEAAGILSDGLLEKIAKEGTIAHIDEIPADIRAVFRCAHDISPEYHIKIQAAFQKHTDNAVSKTVNFNRDATKEQVAEVYLLAYKLDCKGVTIYRDGSRENQVLNIGKGEEKKEQRTNSVQPASSYDADDMYKDGKLPPFFGKIKPRPRPEITKGFTERVKTGCGNLYITVNYDKDGICEVFTSTGKGGGCPSQSESTARLVSIAIRSGVSVDEIYNQLKGIRCPSTVRVQGLNCTSCPDAIAKVIQKVARFQEGKVDEIEPEANGNGKKRVAVGKGKPVAEEIEPAISGEPKKTEELPNISEQRKSFDFSYSTERQKQAQEPRSLETNGAMRDATSFEVPEDIEEEQRGGCPECGSPMEHEGGCVVCRNCGYSKCG